MSYRNKCSINIIAELSDIKEINFDTIIDLFDLIIQKII